LWERLSFLARLPSATILNIESGFNEKDLATRGSITGGTACVYGCVHCSTPTMMGRSLTIRAAEDRLGPRERTEIEGVVVADAFQFTHGDGTAHSALAVEQEVVGSNLAAPTTLKYVESLGFRAFFVSGLTNHFRRRPANSAEIRRNGAFLATVLATI